MVFCSLGEGAFSHVLFLFQISANRFEIKKKLKTAKKKEKKEKKKKQEEEQEKKKLTQIQESQVGNETACSNKLFFPLAAGDGMLPLLTPAILPLLSNSKVSRSEFSSFRCSSYL